MLILTGSSKKCTLKTDFCWVTTLIAAPDKIKCSVLLINSPPDFINLVQDLNKLVLFSVCDNLELYQDSKSCKCRLD